MNLSVKLKKNYVKLLAGDDVPGYFRHQNLQHKAYAISFEIRRATNNFGAEHIVPKLNGAEVSIPRV